MTAKFRDLLWLEELFLRITSCPRNIPKSEMSTAWACVIVRLMLNAHEGASIDTRAQAWEDVEKHLVDCS